MFYVTTIFFSLYTTIKHSQTVEILKDGVSWIDDYNISSNGINGWIDPNEKIVIGSDRKYHGWIYDQNDLQYAGYFWRKFQCQYDSTITISANAYFGCEYDANTDGLAIYVNKNQEQYIISNQIITPDYDAIAILNTQSCSSAIYRGIFDKFTASSTGQTVNQYTTFTVGFRMIHLTPFQNIEFGAISDIKVTCNKIDSNDSSPDPPPNTPTPTYMPIPMPLGKACHSITTSTTCNADTRCTWFSGECS